MRRRVRRGAIVIRLVLVALALLGGGAAAGLGARAWERWQAHEATEARRRSAEQAEQGLRAAGIAMRGGISDLYRHDSESALRKLQTVRERDPGNGYAIYLTAIALLAEGRDQEVPGELSAACQRDWTDYSHVLGLPIRAEMQRERDLLRRGGDGLCAVLSSMPPPTALEALRDLRRAGLRLAALRPASTLHLQRGAQLRVSASEAGLRVARQAKDTAAAQWWEQRHQLDRDWADQVRGEARTFISGLADMTEFAHDDWVERLQAEEALVARLCDRAPE